MKKLGKQFTEEYFLIEDWKTVPGSNDLLCGGWWGYSRHVNYFGEIVQAVALALPGWLATGSVLPWLYPLYYVALFIPRQLRFYSLFRRTFD